MIELSPGVNLHVISTKKYKTIRLYIRFTARHQAQNAAKRTLLTSLLETNSLNYPSQTALSSRLAELYGASFGVTVAKKGNLHQINVGMNIVNDKYVADPQLFSGAVDFLREILFFPHIKDGAFDEATFKVEKENMRAYLTSFKEDKQSYASLSLQELYFQRDADQKTPSFGTLATLEPLTATDLAECYQKMLTEDQVDLFVVGDVEPEEVKEALAVLPFATTERVHPEIMYRQSVENIIVEKSEQEPLAQAKLNLGYQTGIYYDDPRRFPLMVFNGLFGGFPHSKLFMNVREKASLAYYASSNFDSFRGFMSVQTGIDSQNREKVLRLVSEQLASLQAGEITDQAFEQTKAMLKNQYLLSLDNPQALVEVSYLNGWLPETRLSEAEFVTRLETVTKEEVQQVAKEVRLQAVFFLEGEKNA